MRLIDQATQYVANLERKSTAFHAGVIGLLDDSERLVNNALHGLRRHIETLQHTTQRRVTDATHTLERLRPNKVRLP